MSETWDHLGEGEESPPVKVAGRLVALREMGKASFGHLQESAGRLQIYFRQDELGSEGYDRIRHELDLGDFIGVEGPVFRTKTRELTVRVRSFTLLAKSLRSLPEKWHGLKDVEVRYRQRELDLIANAEVRTLFRLRSQVLAAFRKTLEQAGFLEVETPILQSQAGGAIARPFKTFHQALDCELFLRIAPELHLKRLLVGGFEKVFEIGRVFRNEGIDTRHNPEFTILEAYQAYGDYTDMMNVTEQLLWEAAQAVGATELKPGPDPAPKISMKPPYARAALGDLFQKYTAHDVLGAMEKGHLRKVSNELGLPADDRTPEHKILDRVFDAKVVPHLVDPTFVVDYPTKVSPLAKTKREQPEQVERFELFIAGEEIANAYSELNDPIEQRHRLEEQWRRRQGEEEAPAADEEFIRALEYGMPPAGGLGIGVDRVVMLLTGQKSIREAILFPLLKPEK